MSGDERVLVQIEAGEDANTIRDRLSFLRGKRVLLVWPEEGSALPRKLDLVLIQREAMRRAIRLAIVTHDPQIIENARELNISTFETIGASERGRWKRGRAKVFTNRDQRPKNSPNPEDLIAFASRVRFRPPPLSQIQRFLLRLGVLALLVGIVVVIAYLLIPSATIRLVAARQPIEETSEITINTNPAFTIIDVENAVIPAIKLTASIEDTTVVPTTGEQDLGDERARGTVIFINDTSSTVEIPEGTIVSTSTGTTVRFRTTADATLPAESGAVIEVPIEAVTEAEGSVGNVGENLINVVEGPLENQVRVLNPAPTTGGVSRVENAVTEADHQYALDSARQLLLTRALAGFESQITPTQFVILETMRVTNLREDMITYSHAVGQISDTLTITIRADVEAFAADSALGRQIVFARLANQVPRGRAIEQESVQYERSGAMVNGETITFNLTGRAVVSGRIDAGQLQQRLAGMPLDEAMRYLTERVDLAEGTAPQVELTWNIFDRMPLLPLRINVIVENPR